jgi:hypothetical protein
VLSFSRFKFKFNFYLVITTSSFEKRNRLKTHGEKTLFSARNEGNIMRGTVWNIMRYTCVEHNEVHRVEQTELLYARQNKLRAVSADL